MAKKPDPTEAALYAAVVAAPDDDTPRLVLADYWDEHGQPERAEFVRLQCWLATMSPWDEGFVEAKVRERGLWNRHIRRLWKPPNGMTMRTARGFPGEVWVPAGRPSAAVRRYLAAHPVSMFQTEAMDVGGRINVSAFTAGLFAPCRELLLTCRGFETLAAEAIDALIAADPPHLTSLHVIGCLSPDPLRRLAVSPVGHRLHTLALTDRQPDNSFGPDRAGAVATGFPCLRALRLWTPLTLDAARVLARAPWFPDLTDLSLGGAGPNRDMVASALFAGRRLDRLRTLTLWHAGLTTAGFETIASAVPSLEDLWANWDGHPTPLTGGPFRLAGLTLMHHTLDPVQAARVFSGPATGRLRALNLRGGWLNDAGAAALAASPLRETVRVLELSNNRITDAGVRALVAAGPWPELAHLNLTGNALSAETSLDLISHPHLSRVRCLGVGIRPVRRRSERADAAARFIRAVAAEPAAARLRALHLEVSDWPSEAVTAVLDSPHLSQLDMLAGVRPHQLTAVGRRRMNKRFPNFDTASVLFPHF